MRPPSHNDRYRIELTRRDEDGNASYIAQLGVKTEEELQALLDGPEESISVWPEPHEPEFLLEKSRIHKIVKLPNLGH